MICPFCKEEIQEGAIKCKHCGSMLYSQIPSMQGDFAGQVKIPTVPDEIKKWNWAAFLWGPIWAIGHKVWIGLLGFIPFVSFIMNFVLGAKGSQWAWEKGNYASVEQFQLGQKKWVKAWFIIILGSIMLTAIAIPQYMAYQRRGYNAEANMTLRNLITTLEAYCADHQKYPDNSELSKEFGSQIPKDIDLSYGYEASDKDCGSYTATASHKKGDIVYAKNSEEVVTRMEKK